MMKLRMILLAGTFILLFSSCYKSVECQCGDATVNVSVGGLNASKSDQELCDEHAPNDSTSCSVVK